jgi:hypothetical protein
MYSYDRVLPIGSVVLLKNASKRLMIIGYQRKSADGGDKIFDYCGCVYPEGFTSPKDTAIFDHDQIDRLISVGLQNGPQVEFSEKLKEILKKREIVQ